MTDDHTEALAILAIITQAVEDSIPIPYEVVEEAAEVAHGDDERMETMTEMLPNQKKPNLTVEDMQTADCPACTQPTLHIVRGEQKCCLQCAADGGSTIPGYVPLSAFSRWSE